MMDHRVEDGAEFARRLTDHFEHLAGRDLLIDGLVQFEPQPLEVGDCAGVRPS